MSTGLLLSNTIGVERCNLHTISKHGGAAECEGVYIMCRLRVSISRIKRQLEKWS